jgi:hypothetical protein
MNTQNTDKVKMSENIIIADADYVDSVAFNLIVNFERIIGRAIHKADMSQWAVCIALDGGVREGKNDTQIVLVHEKNNKSMDNFEPSDYEKELNSKAFNDNKLGEFTFTSVEAGDMVSKDEYIENVLKTVLQHDEVKRVMIIPDSEKSDSYAQLRDLLRRVDDDNKRITMFAMRPMEGGNFRQEILGYSLMDALGIRADELNK